MFNWIIKIWYFCKEVIEQFFVDGCTNRAAALTYTTLLALVPLMTTSFLLISMLPIAQDWGDKIQQIIFSNFVAGSAKTIQAYLQSFTQQASHLSKPSFIFLFVTAILLLVNIEKALNNIWKLKKTRKSFVAFFLYLAFITLTPLLLALGMGISTYIWTLPFISHTAYYLGIAKPILRLLPFLLTFTAFSLLYWIVPNCKVSIKSALGGGFVAMLLFELAKYAFGLYIRYFHTYKLLYGALSAIPIFLVWVYVSWSITLMGAIVAYRLQYCD